jgi:hypothetical protein
LFYLIIFCAQWNVTDTTYFCDYISDYCPVVATPLNGANATYLFDSLRLGGTTYAGPCDTAYELHGAASRVCGGGNATVGIWKNVTVGDADPTCELIVGWCREINQTAEFPYGSFDSSDLRYTDVVQFHCGYGYQFAASSPTNATCQLNQDWTTIPTCELIPQYCAEVPAVAHGSATYNPLDR